MDTQEAKDLIIEQIVLGKSLSKVKRENPELPSIPTIYTWLNEESNKYDKAFLNNYTRAKGESAEADFDKIQDICHDVLDGITDYQAGRVAMNGLMWIAGKKKPKKYGEAQLLKIGDTDGKNIQPNVLFPNVPILMPKSNVQANSSPEEDTGDDKTD